MEGDESIDAVVRGERMHLREHELLNTTRDLFEGHAHLDEVDSHLCLTHITGGEIADEGRQRAVLEIEIIATLRSQGAGEIQHQHPAIGGAEGVILRGGNDLSENGEFQVQQQTVITPNAAIHALDGMRLETGEQYYIRIHAEEDSIGANYELYIKADVEDASLITDNNTMETATELSRTEDTAARIQSWVGAGDALDYYRLELDRSGNLTIRLDELETNVRVKVYQERSNGSTSLKYITTARASEGLEQPLALTSGTYFIEIASNDNGAGRYNSTYALELEKEEEGENHRFTIANA